MVLRAAELNLWHDIWARKAVTLMEFILIKVNLLKPHYKGRKFKIRTKAYQMFNNFEEIPEGTDWDREMLALTLAMGFLLGVATMIAAMALGLWN